MENLQDHVNKFCSKLADEISKRRGVNLTVTDVFDAAWELHKIANELKGLYINKCNRPQTQVESQTEDMLEYRAQNLAEELGLAGIEVGGDPRGAAVKIVVEHVHGDDFGEPKRLLCVPTTVR